MKKAVFFDAGFTLIDMFEARKPDLLQYFCESYSTIDLSHLNWKKGQIEAEKHFQIAVQYEEYFFSTKFWIDNYVVGLLASGLPFEKAFQVAQEVTVKGRKEKRKLSLDPDCLITLSQLRQRGLKLGVVSNWNGTLKQVLVDLGILEYFDYVADSRVEGYEKPDPRLFQIPLQKIGVEPCEVLHVGDLYHTDVVGAKKAGIDAVLLDHIGEMDTLFDCRVIRRLRDVVKMIEEKM